MARLSKKLVAGLLVGDCAIILTVVLGVIVTEVTKAAGAVLPALILMLAAVTLFRTSIIDRIVKAAGLPSATGIVSYFLPFYLAFQLRELRAKAPENKDTM